jgi:putative Mg2+ transporter-C (MgtC) family protein
MDVSTGEQLHIIGRFAIAGGLGALIGLEREVRGYPAGIRTIALVAAGAALFTDISSLFTDPASSRVASNIVVGIGFIGAGVILRASGRIHGITTAATIWAAAAIGMAVGMSLYLVGLLSALIIVCALEMRPLTRRLDRLLFSLIGRFQEDEENEDLSLAWRRTRRQWQKEEAKDETRDTAED